MIPQNYTEWHHCITVDCGIVLSTEFLQQRIAIYTDAQHKESVRFVELYGVDHLNNVLEWLRQAAHTKT